MTSKSYDAVVIGSGAGGSAVAWRLAEKGLSVLLLEAGPSYNPRKDYKLHTNDWEVEGFPFKAGSQGQYSFSEMQKLDADWDDLKSWNKLSGKLNTLDRRKPSGPGYHHVRGVGGSTLHFTGEAHRLNPHAMKMKSRFGVGADWPVSYEMLEPYYVEAEKQIGVAGPSSGGDRWRSEPYPLPAHPFSLASKKLITSSNKLNLKWVPNSRAALSQPYDGRPSCNYCGNCNRGCPVTDKGSSDVTFVAKALLTKRCELRTGITVTHIATGKDSKVSHIEFLDQSGTKHKQTVKTLIIACGAVETPRLLLHSQNDLTPMGLANESGQVGKNLLETLFWVSSGSVAEQIFSFKGLPSDTICWDFNRPDSIPGVKGGCRFSSAVQEASLVGPINYSQRIVPGWGKAHKTTMRESIGRVLSVGAIGEFLPNAGTYVDLDQNNKDRFGLPLARIHSHLEPMDIKRLRFMAEKCRGILKAAGVQELVEEYGTADFFNTTHIFGTCRMGANPATSVVNSECRSHTWQNLYICDASVFPSTGGGESPSLTIQALAIRAADTIIAEK